eukprot:SAG11_NODE_51_length_19848_cov_37.780698_4_plen_1016_part_00
MPCIGCLLLSCTTEVHVTAEFVKQAAKHMATARRSTKSEHDGRLVRVVAQNCHRDPLVWHDGQGPPFAHVRHRTRRFGVAVSASQRDRRARSGTVPTPLSTSHQRTTQQSQLLILLGCLGLAAPAKAQLSPVCFMTEGSPSCDNGRFCCAPGPHNGNIGCCDADPSCLCDDMCPNMMASPTFPGMDLLGTCVEDQYCPTTAGIWYPGNMFTGTVGYCRCVAAALLCRWSLLRCAEHRPDSAGELTVPSLASDSVINGCSGEMYNGVCMDNFQYVDFLGPGCTPGCLPPTPPPPPDAPGALFPPMMTPCAVPRPDPIAAPAPPGMCDHNSGESCCSVGGSSYLDTSTPDPSWGNRFTVEECFGPSGPRSRTQMTHAVLGSIGSATTWGGANYVVYVHPCCLEPGAQCGLILQIHGFLQQPGDMESATNLAGHAGAAEDLAQDACGSQRFIVVEAQSRSDAALPGDMDKHWRAAWVNEDADMHAEFMRHTAALYDVDRAHIHVTGYSEGSFATWNLLCKHSDLVCSVAPAEFPPYGIENPSGDGCTMGSTAVAGGSEFQDATTSFGGLTGDGLAFGQYDVAPTCFADPRSASPDFEPRSILFQFGRRETICGDSGESAGVATMEATRALVAQAYLGHDLSQVSYEAPSPPGWTGDWRAYTLDSVGSGGVVFETITHPYHDAALPIGVPVEGVVWPGHCLPNRAAGIPFPSCEGAAAYSWGEEVVRFFRQNPCTDIAQPQAQGPPPPPQESAPAPAPAPQTPKAPQAAQECDSIGDLTRLAGGLTGACCDDDSDGCVDGMPAHCDSDCAATLLEMQAVCSEYLSASRLFGELTQSLDAVAATCPASVIADPTACMTMDQFAHRVDAVTSACCDDDGPNSCANGYPTECDSQCGATLLPMQADCSVFLEANNRFLGAARVQLDRASAVCGSQPPPPPSPPPPPPPPSSCTRVDGGGGDQPCTFPFFYGGVEYNTCTDIDTCIGCGPWCIYGDDPTNAYNYGQCDCSNSACGCSTVGGGH